MTFVANPRSRENCKSSTGRAFSCCKTNFLGFSADFLLTSDKKSISHYYYYYIVRNYQLQIKIRTVQSKNDSNQPSHLLAIVAADEKQTKTLKS